ncbi:MAG: hypothetical protein AB1450_13315 [Pseudomonadota bacterium]
MPVCTFVSTPPGRHEDAELQDLLDEVRSLTGDDWYAQTTTTRGRWRLFGVRMIGERTDLYKRLCHGQYQEMMCVNTVREAKCYLLGLLSGLGRGHNAPGKPTAANEPNEG